jgi:hypothetical protein
MVIEPRQALFARAPLKKHPAIDVGAAKPEIDAGGRRTTPGVIALSHSNQT